MQGLNLIRDAWIPFRHESGKRSLRAPFDLFGEPDDPIVAVASPRADLDGGIVQLLIGLLHAALAPANDRAWAELAKAPPNAELLREKLEPFAAAFELLGEGPRFYQDPSVAAYGGEPWSIEKLFGDLGLDRGPDHFARVGSVRQLCSRCAAAAIATLQAGAPPGGRGHLASLRGVGPLTTLVVPADPNASLWAMLWLNVLPFNRLRSDAEVAPPRSAEIFPWLDTPKVEPENSPERTPQELHPVYVFFSMPRRIWLGPPSQGDCGLCGQNGEVFVDYLTRPKGNRYVGGVWRHPLSPYRRKDELWWAFKADPRDLGYRHWLGLVMPPPGGDSQPAQPVELLRRIRFRAELAGPVPSVWAFGYALDNIKALAWNDGLMPVFEVAEDIELAFASQVSMLVDSAQQAEYFVRKAFKSLVARRAQDVKRDPEQIVARFWQDTETPFYAHAEALLRALQKDAAEVEAATLAQRESWHRTLCARAREIFDTEVGEADFSASSPRQVAEAWKELQRSLYGKKLKDTLGLPVTQEKKKKGGRT